MLGIQLAPGRRQDYYRDTGGGSSNDKFTRESAGLCLGKCCFVSERFCRALVLPITTNNSVDPSFAAPSDCYNIALVSRRFFQPVSCSAAAPQRRGGQSQMPNRKSKRQKTAGSSSPLLLATRMLRVSLEHNLDCVLKHSCSGITLVSTTT